MLSLLLAAALPMPAQDASYKHIMECLATAYLNSQAEYRRTGKMPNDDLWLNEVSQKSLAAVQREHIPSAQYSADMARAMDESRPPPLDAAGYAACKAEFGYHLN